MSIKLDQNVNSSRSVKDVTKYITLKSAYKDYISNKLCVADRTKSNCKPTLLSQNLNLNFIKNL